MRSLSSGRIALRVLKLPTDLAESRSGSGGSGDWDCMRAFCRSGDEERTDPRGDVLSVLKLLFDLAEFCRSGDRERDPSTDLLRERSSECIFAVFRPLPFRGDSDDCKRSCVMVKPAQISRRLSVELGTQAEARSGPDWCKYIQSSCPPFPRTFHAVLPWVGESNGRGRPGARSHLSGSELCEGQACAHGAFVVGSSSA